MLEGKSGLPDRGPGSTPGCDSRAASRGVVARLRSERGPLDREITRIPASCLTPGHVHRATTHIAWPLRGPGRASSGDGPRSAPAWISRPAALARCFEGGRTVPGIGAARNAGPLDSAVACTTDT